MRTYNRILFSTALCLLVAVFAVNTFMDTFWYLGTTNLLCTRKFIFDERAQKTNLLLNMAPRYDALLLGSSRVSYMPPALFRKCTLFNYALGSVYPDEYEAYVSAARLRHPVRTVYIGLDFYGTSSYKMFPPDHLPADYVAGATKPLRKLGALLSGDGLKYAFKTARLSVSELGDGYYDRDYVKHLAPFSRDQQAAVVLAQLRLYHEKGYGTRYVWNKGLAGLLHGLRAKHPDIRFVIFTTPISAPMFSLLVRDGRLPDYERWLRLLVAEFGAVYDFMGLNSVTKDLCNYSDAHHFLALVGEHIANRLGGTAEGVPPDFGSLVTARNMEGHLAQMRRQAQEADPDPLGTFGRRVDGTPAAR
jgi:hypothetical protein